MKTIHSFLVTFSIVIISVLALAVSVNAAADVDQHETSGEMMANPKPAVTLRYDPIPNSNRVPPPDWFTARSPEAPPLPAGIIMNFLPAGSADARWGDITITWPADALDAAMYAARIWASGLNTTIPITINAGWVNNLASGVLGHSGSLAHFRDFTGAPQTATWYPVSLANTKHGSDIDPANADMYIGLSSKYNWYNGTDGNTPASEVDLVSVVLHEICHGLGFAGSMNGSETEGKWGLSPLPTNPKRYDRFAEDINGVSLLNTTTYPNPSVALKTVLTSGNVFFDGYFANLGNGGNRVPLFAPSYWKGGSSFSHLGETYNNTVNALMTYSFSSGESAHSPGPVTTGLLRDIGWPFNMVSVQAPTGVSATDGTYVNKVYLTWNYSAGATHYIVYRSVSRYNIAVPITGEILLNYFEDTTAIPGRSYNYSVKAGSAWSTSGISASDAGSKLGPPNTVVAHKGVSSNSVQVFWSACPGATKYAVYRNSVNFFGTAQLMSGNHSSTIYTDAGLPLATAYYYWIKAGNNNGWSGISDEELGFTAFELAAPGDWTYKDGKKNDKLKGKNLSMVLSPYLTSGYQIGIRDTVTDTIINGPHTLTTKNQKVWFYKEKKAVKVKYKEIYNKKKDTFKTQVKFTVWGDIPMTNTVFVRKAGEPASVANEVEFNLIQTQKTDENGWQILEVRQ